MIFRNMCVCVHMHKIVTDEMLIIEGIDLKESEERNMEQF